MRNTEETKTERGREKETRKKRSKTDRHVDKRIDRQTDRLTAKKRLEDREGKLRKEKKEREINQSQLLTVV